jgi:hypothetical protein
VYVYKNGRRGLTVRIKLRAKLGILRRLWINLLVRVDFDLDPDYVEESLDVS